MIQLQALNYILKNKDADLLTTYDSKYYFNYEVEYKTIRAHYDKYKTVPDVLTVLDTLPDFSVIDTNESKQYIEQKLYEEYVYEFTKSTMAKKKDLFKTDSVKAKNEIISELANLHPPRLSYGTNIIAKAQDRYNKLIDTLASPNADKFSTGLPELDMKLGGGMHRGEEVIVLFARTNNAKTWVAEKFAVSVWEDGHNVGFFSPEMSAISIGQRFDTLHKNFSNNAIQGNDVSYNTDKYKTYIGQLAKSKTIFSVTSPLDFDREVTVSKLRKWVTDLDLKFLVIDGLTYLKNERTNGHQPEHERLTDITEDLMTLSNELLIPIVVVVQANREAAKDANGEVNNDTPEIDTIRGSDGISHNASRVISIRCRDSVLTLYLNKNRYGEVNNKIIYNYDINTGKFTYVDNPKSGLNISSEDSRSQFEDNIEGL